LADAVATILGEDGQVVDVDEGTGSEGGEPKEADGDADWLGA
jgi:hypothetical protein